ncbi:MAG TPA: Wzz/FepE/Etk N-terminal domain-containing protein, partial [Candidatus Aquilonibacter sp.]|nr:Wzz/FepE/Etk N-terminal domain-containing protein [Candidatus Aquilonibacter sp.]
MAKDLANSRGLLVGPFEDEPEYFKKPERMRPRGRGVAQLRLLWSRRRLLWRAAAIGLVISTAVAFLLPQRFDSTTRLMPPDPNDSGMMMMAALAGRTAGSNFAGLAGDLLGLRSTGVLFIGILRSRTVEDDLINRFDLRKEYSHKRWEATRTELAALTKIEEDRKTGIISITVTDKSPQRAAAMAQEYVDQLNRVITELNTSSAHRERVFLEERLGQVKQDLESAEKDFSVFASKNGAIDIKEQGRAMIDAAAALEGELIAAQTELESLRQVYTDSNVRVRATQARVDELKRQLKKIGGTESAKGTTQAAESAGGAAAGASGAGNTKGDGEAADAAGAGKDDLYPSIRQLPILGVNYADLYRRTKVQEAVFETLTQQYELAKVQEA